MIKLFEFHFLDIYNEEYVISIYDSESDVQGEIKTAKLYGQDGFILNYEKENIDIVQGGIIKSDVTFSVVNEGGILDNFLKNLQSYENRYLVEIMYNENIFWRGIMLNDYITFDDSKIQVIKFNCTDGLGLLQNIDYTDDISKLDSTTMQFDSDAYGNGLIDVISRALSFNPVTKFFEGSYNYIYYKSDYISDDMLNDWDALVYTNILKHKENTTLLTTPFADYTLKDTLSGKKIKIYEYKSCYDVINECLKVFNLCLCQRGGVWQIFNIRDFENNKDNYIYHVADYNKYNYYKNIKNKTAGASVSNAKCAIGGTSDNKRGSGEFGLNSVVKKIEQRYVPYYVKEGTFNNLIYSGNHGGDLQWYSYPAGVITGISNGNVVYEANFNNWNLCSKYHYHNELDIFTAMTKLQFLINFAIKYTLSAGSGYVHTSMIKPKMDLNLKINGKWLDSNGNWVDNLPSGNWWHKFTGVFDGYDRVINVNFSKYFDLLIPNQSSGKLVVDFYFRIYTQTNVIGTLPWNFKITNIENNSVLKLVDNNGNDIESIDYIVENDSGILDLELEQAFIDNFSESEENNVLFTAVQDLGLNSYRYKKSKKWRHSDETNYYNLVELRLREIAAMNNHPLLNWQGTIYYDKDTNVNYMLFYLIKYNLTLQNYVMFPQRWTFYARKRYAEASLIEVSKDFLKVISGNVLAIVDYNVPIVYLDNGIFTDNNGNVTVQANSINLTVNDTVNNLIRLINKSGEIDYIINYDDRKRSITLNNETGALLAIDDNGLYYKNEKGAGNGIEIDSNNKINVKIDNDTIKIDENNKLYANINEIVRYMQDSIAKYDKYDYAIIECFLEDNIEIAFPDYTYFNGLRAFPVNEIKNTVFRYIKFTGDFVMDNLEVANDYEFYSSVFTSDFNCPNLQRIGVQAFRYSQFNGSFNCPNLQEVGNGAFRYSQFNGSFNCPQLQEVGYNAFYSSEFTGDFNCPNLQEVGYNAFYSSEFTGNFDCQELQEVGIGAFRYSQFNGSFNCPNLLEVGQYAFANSQFTGDFNCPNLQEVGVDAFLNSEFTGDFDCPNVQTVDQYAFYLSLFTGDFDCPNVQTVDQYAFYLSLFTGNFDCPNLQTVGESAFLHSVFDGAFNCPNLQTVDYNAFRNSVFNGVFNCPNLQTVGYNAFRNSVFTGDFDCPNLQTVEESAFLHSVFDGAFNCPNLQRVERYAFENSKFTGDFNCPDLQAVGERAFKFSQFTGSFNCPNVTSVGDNVFLNSNFTKITIGANANLGTGCIGAHSGEFINDYAANGKLAGTYVWDEVQQHWIYQG